jgi:hypothetical protein
MANEPERGVVGSSQSKLLIGSSDTTTGFFETNPEPCRTPFKVNHFEADLEVSERPATPAAIPVESRSKISKQARWKIKQRQLKRELATTEWQLGYGGKVVRSTGRQNGLGNRFVGLGVQSESTSSPISKSGSRPEPGSALQPPTWSQYQPGITDKVLSHGRVTAAKLIVEMGKENQSRVGGLPGGLSLNGDQNCLPERGRDSVNTPTNHTISLFGRI